MIYNCKTLVLQACLRCVHGQRWRVLLVSVGALCSPSLAATPDLLSITAAQRIAVSRSAQISAQDYAAVASRELAIVVQQLPDPVLKFGVNNLPVEGEDRFSFTRDFMTMRNIGVMQEFTRADKRQFRSELYTREAEKLAAEKSLAVTAIQRDTALAWIDRYYLEAMAITVADQMVQAKFEIQAAEAGYRGGKGNLNEVLAARSGLLTFEDKASELKRRVTNATTMLGRWVGTAATRPLAEMPPIDSVKLDITALETALSHHPQIEVLNRQEAMARTEVRLAEANRKSDWTGEIMLSQRGPLYANMISAGVSIPLQINRKNKQDRELTAKLAKLEEAKALREEALRSHTAEVGAMVAEWQSGRERLGRFQRSLIPLASDNTSAAVSAYRGGKASLTQVFAARRGELDVRIQALQMEYDTARVWAQLNYLVPEDQTHSHIHE